MRLTIPHETARQAAIHTCWPADAALWEADLGPAEAEFARFLGPLAEPGSDGRRPDLVVYAATARAEANARKALGGRATVVRAAYGDVWARDTGPVFGLENGRLTAVRFRFNGWGGKYELPGDQTIGATIAARAGAEIREVDLTGEGGALEFDGDGTVITTRQCLLNSNRNPRLSEPQVEARLIDALGVKQVIWLDEGLAGDHTDGHVDNLARFVRPGVVACQAPSGSDDPNRKVLDAVARQLGKARDARGRRLEVVRIPSPGRVEDADGAPAAASHMNWVIGPRSVVLPAYNDRARTAAAALTRLFGSRKVFVSPARRILTGGGAFHCVTCNQPAGAG
ncbi:agmatine deiminase [Marinicauda salina]|uniref:Agmatine deiminase n=1 Tax=Marinicauda salina TaxID=2135793 RepID=A0A2U2BQX2_9PROT|nr:agmatine deiminase family protein [Marinicauda salina]PWE16396.1 agmatine deiminase [Marinicauda salina]